MFVILQKYDFSSKSQRPLSLPYRSIWCLWYCKSTIFQANHNCNLRCVLKYLMFVILQKYDFSSKSQLDTCTMLLGIRCLWYCKSTIFQANHNQFIDTKLYPIDVCDTAKVRFFKQITTPCYNKLFHLLMFVILQKYDFSSKSQPDSEFELLKNWCLWYCKSTIFQANHNVCPNWKAEHEDVCDTAKVRFFKQITTKPTSLRIEEPMFVILQKYDFSSKSQRENKWKNNRCDVCDTAKVRFFKQITTQPKLQDGQYWCLWYCKSTIFQANHNKLDKWRDELNDVCDTAKVRFFKQITTILM